MRGAANRHEPGRFCWPELATTDAAAARGFYEELFGWTHRDAAARAGAAYAIFMRGGQDSAALYSLAESPGERSAPPRWNSYVAVTSADASAAAAASLGGTVVTAPFDVGMSGRTAVVRDPQGAVLYLWEARGSPGIGVEGEVGSLCWTELATSDVDAARRYYASLFGWTYRRGSGADGYTEIAAGREFIGGMLPIEEDWGEAMPAWRPYFRVADCDVAVADAKTLGARILAGPTDLPNVGRTAFVADPQGATFAVISFEAFA
jgi:predicted enzyme related to lactoylglutathione lyase